MLQGTGSDVGKTVLVAGLCRAARRRGMAVMAYSPFDEGRLLRNRHLRALAARLDATPAQVALAWLLAQPDVAVIPKAGDAAHVRDNVRALSLALSDDVRREIDAFLARFSGTARAES